MKEIRKSKTQDQKKKDLTDFSILENIQQTMTMVWTHPETGRQQTAYTNASVDTAWTWEKGKRNHWMKAIFYEIVQRGE